jgi:hypothetical protein
MPFARSAMCATDSLGPGSTSTLTTPALSERIERGREVASSVTTSSGAEAVPFSSTR